MILIADSGSTKTSWRIISSSGEVKSIETSGINPFFRSSDDIERELRKELLPFALNIQKIFFYGAGIVNDEKASIVIHALRQLFGEIPVHAYSDVVGAARSVCRNKPGIACVLGTGSSACLYDGVNIIDAIPPMGFILGDEGSGVAMGKNLIGDYFKKIMPEKLRHKFQQQYKISKVDVLEKVYKREKPNQYLASFTLFISENIDEKYCSELVRQNLRSFITRNIKNIEGFFEMPVHFVGSVAFVFQNLLIEVIEDEGLMFGQVVKDPVDGLVAYHQNQEL